MNTQQRPGLKEEIIRLRNQGLTYNQIKEQVKCSSAIISYHLNSDVRENTLHRSKVFHQNEHPYKRKIVDFCGRDGLTLDEVISKFGEQPICYITGESIDIYKTRSYHFDHIIPKSKGGDNSISNLGICTRAANLAKADKTYQEFIDLCKTSIDYYLKGVNQS